MEGISGPSELELSKERIIALKLEYQKLTYEIKKREPTKNSNNYKLQQQIKQQWNKIEELKNEKSELVLQLRLNDSQSFTKPGSKNLEMFLKSLEDLIKLEKQVESQTDELKKYTKQIERVDKKIRKKRKGLIQSYRNKDRVLKLQKNIPFLQNRLSESLTKYSIQLQANGALREDIKSILQTQAAFRKQYSHLKQLISSGKKNISEIVNSATTSYQTSESAKFKLNLLKERTRADQKKLDAKIKELQILIEQDKQLKAMMELKDKDRGILSAREVMETKKYQIIEQKLLEYPSILTRIESVASCKDANKICKIYIEQEELKAILFEEVNSVNVEMEKLQEDVDAERADLGVTYQHFKEQNRKDLAKKNDIDDLTEKYRLDAQDLEDAADAEAGELEDLKKTLQAIYQRLSSVSTQDVTLTVDESITDDNIVLYLEALERRVLELIDYQQVLDKKYISYYDEE